METKLKKLFAVVTSKQNIKWVLLLKAVKIIVFVYILK
jgi:hypothetical protein